MTGRVYLLICRFSVIMFSLVMYIEPIGTLPLSWSQTMRALIFGQTGVHHEEAFKSLESYISEHFTQTKVKFFRLEDSLDGPLTTYVAADTDIPFRREWGNAFRRTLAKIPDDGTHVLLSMHATYYRDQRFITPQDVSLIQQFRPDLCITLIDDLTDVWYRLYQRWKERSAYGYFRLDELALWRTAEISFADMISQVVVTGEAAVKNYVLAVKHPVETLYKLLFNRDRLRVYACCGITKPREIPALRTEIDAYRNRLSSEYTVFDPLTVDEGPIYFAFTGSFPNINLAERDPKIPWRTGDPEPTISVNKDARWPLTPESRLVASVFERVPHPNEVTIPATEVIRLCSRPSPSGRPVIYDQITHRDLRLVAQCHAMPAWRPYLGHEWAGGQSSELQHTRSNAVSTVVYWPEEDGERPTKALDPSGLYYSSEAEFWKEIKFQAEDQRRRLRKQGIDFI